MINQLFRRVGGASRAALLAAAGVLTLLFAACDGDNLFEGRGALGSGPPRILNLVVPAQAAENARVDVRIRALAPRGLTKVNVRFRGAAAEDREVTFDPARTDTVVADISIDLPATLLDSVLRVEAYVTDGTGAVSDISTGTIRIVDATAPTVTLGAISNQASVGATVEVPVSVRDPFGIRSVGYAFITAANDTILRQLIPTQGAARDTVFRVQIPGSMPPGQVSVVAMAVNQANIAGVSAPLALTIVDQFGPIVEITEPANNESLPIRDSIRVRVHARDSSGIANIRIEGISFRNFPDTTQNSPRVVRFPAVNVPLPQGPQGPPTRDTTVFRFLKPNADTVSEPVFFIATVTDAFGNVGVDTVRVTPGPRVAILYPTTGTTVRVGRNVTVRLTAHDPQLGVDSMHLYIAGAGRSDTLRIRGLAATREVVDTTVSIPAGAAVGTLQLRAAVWNTQRVRGSTSNAVALTVTDQANTGTPPLVRRTLTLRERVELRDPISVRVTATDQGGAGISRIGAVVIATPASGLAAPDTFFFSTPQGTDRPDATFTFQLRERYSELIAAQFPLDFTFHVHAFAVNTENRCAASVLETNDTVPCLAVVRNGVTYYTADRRQGTPYAAKLVVGTSRALKATDTIADALPDTANNRVYLSNVARNQVEVLEVVSMDSTRMRAVPVSVGSEPWGLFLAPGGPGGVDTLMVGNSGGTNLSFVPTNTLREDARKRLLTPNEVLYDVKETLSNGRIRYFITAHEFSDRPQFVAQDNNRNILYSTRPTRSAVEGTARMARAPLPGGRAEPVILIPGGTKSITESEDTWAIAHVDSIKVVPSATGDDHIIIYDHRLGFPADTLSTEPAIASVAILDIIARGSDIVYARGRWNRAAVGFSDTTYVAWSKDLSTIAFGEGDKTPDGRIMLWQTLGTGRLSSNGTFDLIGNAAETVNGLALNANGSIGVARGLSSTYFFTNDVDFEGQLRLHGVFAAGVSGGSGGVALHPAHIYDLNDGSNENTLAFVATSSQSIKIVDTFHYRQRGEIFIRDNVLGQLRAAPPMPGVNAGITDPRSCSYTVVQLFGVTAGNNVVMVNVRRRDIREINTDQPNCNQ